MAKEQKDEKIQVLLSTEDFEELSKKISKQALTKGDPPVSVSHYVRKLIRRDLGRATED
jgi:predicted nucleic acid-binding protein